MLLDGEVGLLVLSLGYVSRLLDEVLHASFFFFTCLLSLRTQLLPVLLFIHLALLHPLHVLLLLVELLVAHEAVCRLFVQPPLVLRLLLGLLVALFTLCETCFSLLEPL